MDAEAHGLGQAGAFPATGAGVHDAGLSARSRAHERACAAAGAGHRGSRETGSGMDAGGRPSAASVAWGSEDHGGDPGQRVGHDLAFPDCTATDGLQRRGSRRGLQWRAGAARSHHQNRQRPSATRGDRGRLVVSTSPRHRPGLAATAERRQRRSERDRLESAAPIAQEISEAHGGRQRPKKNRLCTGICGSEHFKRLSEKRRIRSW